MLISVTKGFPGELNPCVGEKLSVGAPHTNPHDGTSDTAVGQHSRQGHRAYEALRTEHSEPSGAYDRERDSARFGQPLDIHVPCADSRCGEPPDRSPPQRCLCDEQRPLRVQELSPLSERERRELLRDVGR